MLEDFFALGTEFPQPWPWYHGMPWSFGWPMGYPPFFFGWSIDHHFQALDAHSGRYQHVSTIFKHIHFKTSKK